MDAQTRLRALLFCRSCEGRVDIGCIRACRQMRVENETWRKQKQKKSPKRLCNEGTVGIGKKVELLAALSASAAHSNEQTGRSEKSEKSMHVHERSVCITAQANCIML
jgi:hypothetical protein